MKVLTAIGKPDINERLKKEYKYEVIGRDIQYQEGILEILEEREDIETILLSNNLPEEINFNILISKIININKKIEIIVFLKEKNEDIENFLNSKKIYKIYYLDNYELFFINLKNKISNIDISKNIEEFKSIIFNETNNIDKSYVDKKIYLSTGKIISISGVFGSGKSIISILLGKYLSKNNRVLLIDFDFFNNSISTILGVKKIVSKGIKDNYLDSIIKYEKNLYVLNSLDKFITENQIENKYFITNLFEKIKNKFDFIIVDTSSNIKFMENKIIFSNSSEIVFLIEPNLSEIKKSNIYLEKILTDFEIENSKINIIFNKTNKYKFSEEMLKEIYPEFKVIGEIEYNDKYNLIINKNIFKEINLYEKIFNKLL